MNDGGMYDGMINDGWMMVGRIMIKWMDDGEIQIMGRWLMKDCWIDGVVDYWKNGGWIYIYFI